MQTADYIVIGAGIAGASIAWQLVQDGRSSVLLLERESQPGYHTTGRSAALYMATYGTPNIQALTRASRAFYDAPPPEFGADPILSPRGVIYVAGPDQLDLLKRAYDDARAASPNVEWVDKPALLAQLPCLKPEAVAAGMSEPEAADIDVHALHQGYLRGLRQRGGQVLTQAEVVGLRKEGDAWHVALADGRQLRGSTIVNAAGAWADVVAAMAGVPPIGLEPRRRTAFTFTVPDGMDASHWPAVIGIDEGFYFKPDAGQLLGSPANADGAARGMGFSANFHQPGPQQRGTARLLRAAQVLGGLQGSGDQLIAQCAHPLQHGGQVGHQRCGAAQAQFIPDMAPVKHVGRLDEHLGRHAAHPGARGAPGAVVHDEVAIGALAHLAQGRQPRSARADDDGVQGCPHVPFSKLR